MVTTKPVQDELKSPNRQLINWLMHFLLPIPHSNRFEIANAFQHHEIDRVWNHFLIEFRWRISSKCFCVDRTRNVIKYTCATKLDLLKHSYAFELIVKKPEGLPVSTMLMLVHRVHSALAIYRNSVSMYVVRFDAYELCAIWRASKWKTTKS